MRIKSTLVLAIIVLCTGCSHQTKLMKTPVVVTAGGINPLERVLPARQVSEAPVFIASGRTVSKKTDDPAQFYTNDRSRAVRLGRATVEIGAGMSWDEVVHESLAEKRDQDVPVKLTKYEEYGPLWSSEWPASYRFDRGTDAQGRDTAPAEAFIKAIEAELDQCRRRQITLYVHGFNTKFDKNVELASEFWHYMARDGVIISFDWPSKDSLFSYEVDRANANFAIWQCRRLLEFLAENTSAARINIIAHSAGNPVVVESLRQLSLISYNLDDEAARARTKIGRVVLAAPDMDLDSALSASVDGAGRITQGVAVYASQRDRALKFSGNIFKDVRLGRSIGKLSDSMKQALIESDGQWIDVTPAQDNAPSFLGHSYFHQNPWVSSDVMLYLRVGATPEQRGLVRDQDTGFLVFPEDYVEQLPAIVERLNADKVLETSE